MGLFDILLGSSAHYSPEPHPLTREQIRRLVSRLSVRTLTAEEEQAVEQAIDAARYGDGHISLQTINTTLHSLEQEHRISANDRKGLIKVFSDFFSHGA